ncbi:MAG: RIP metalloprotease RseP [Bacteroidota bacterium]
MDFLLTAFSYIFWVALALSILVFVHELGHYLAARVFGMRVDKFSIGFPPKIIGKKFGDTEWVIGATPLGGYVKIAGMIDESMDADFVGSEPQPDEFRSKPVWQRIVVITAGVLFNLVFAFLIYIGLAWGYGDTFIPAENVEQVYVADGSIAYEMGLRTGDRVVAVNGEALERYDDFERPDAFVADPFTVTVERDGREQTFTGPDQLLSRLSSVDAPEPGITPFGTSIQPAIIGGVFAESAADEAGLLPGDQLLTLNGEPVALWNQLTDAVQAADGAAVALTFARPTDEGEDAPDAAETLTLVEERADAVVYETSLAPRFDEDLGRYLIGIAGPDGPILEEVFGIERRDLGLGQAIAIGSQDATRMLSLYVTAVGRLFTGKEDVRESVGGPVMIAKVTKEAADTGMYGFWQIVAFLSVALAVMNILPIPALDGGHLVFLVYEGITRREPSVRVRMVAQQVGFVLLLALMVFVIFNDIARF